MSTRGLAITILSDAFSLYFAICFPPEKIAVKARGGEATFFSINATVDLEVI